MATTRNNKDASTSIDGDELVLIKGTICEHPIAHAAFKLAQNQISVAAAVARDLIDLYHNTRMSMRVVWHNPNQLELVRDLAKIVH